MSEELDPVLADFRNFLYLVWQHLNLPEPTPVQYDIADYLQGMTRRRIVEAFRGVGKSWITSAYVCWLLLRDPQEKILVVSASKERADAFSTFTKRLINEMPILQHLAPKHGQRDSNVAFDVAPALPAHAPSVKSVGITGQITGSRATRIVADDIETPKNSLTQLMRDRLAELIKEFDAVISPGGEITYLGTPQTEMSVYNVLPERGYEMRVWPARIPQNDKLKMYKGRLAPFILDLIDSGAKAWEPVDPIRFNDLDLIEREASYGRSGFSLQFMLDTSLSDAEKYPLKLSDLMVMPLDLKKAPVSLAWGSSPEYLHKDLPMVGLQGDGLYRPMFIDKDFADYEGSFMFIDPSGRGKDETAYAVVKYLHGMLYVADCGGLSGGYDRTTLETLARIAKKHAVNLIHVEPNYGGGMFTELFKPVCHTIYNVTIEDGEWVTTQKEKRIIDVLEPVMNQHRLIFDESIVSSDYQTEDVAYQLFYQMTRLTKDKGALRQDDRLDALAGAVKYWVDRMAQDVNKAAQNRRDDLLQRELDKFQEHCFGNKQKSATWMSNVGHRRT